MNKAKEYSHKVLDCESATLVQDIEELVSLPFSEFRSLTLKNRKMKGLEKGDTIAFQYVFYRFGGVERVTYASLLMFQEMGYKVILYTDEPATPNDLPLPSGVIRKQIPPASNMANRVKFWHNEVKEENLRAVFYSAHYSESALADALAIQSEGALFAYFTHGSAPFYLQAQRSDLPCLMQRMGGIADAVLTLSHMDALFWKAFSERVYQVVNPVEIYMGKETPKPLNDETHNIVWAGRIDSFDKQVFELAYILKEVVTDVPDAQLIIAGEGVEEAALKELVNKLELNNNVQFVGYQDDVTPFYQQANVLLITSVAECFPLTLAEAMQQGRPVVAYELPYLELFQGEGAIQVPQGNRRAAAKEIAEILKDAQKQRELGEQAQKTYNAVCKENLQEGWKKTLLAICDSNSTSQVQSTDFDCFKTLLQTLLFQSSVLFERQQQKRLQVQTNVAANEQRVAQLENELQSVRSSKSFRLGVGLTAIPRKLKRLLKH